MNALRERAAAPHAERIEALLTAAPCYRIMQRDERGATTPFLRATTSRVQAQVWLALIERRHTQDGDDVRACGEALVVERDGRLVTSYALVEL